MYELLYHEKCVVYNLGGMIIWNIEFVLVVKQLAGLHCISLFFEVFSLLLINYAYWRQRMWQISGSDSIMVDYLFGIDS